MALTRLASLINASAEPGKFIAIAENLEDVSREALMLAFVHMERNRTTKEGMPTPAEIRTLGTNLLAERRRQEREEAVVVEMRGLRKRQDAGEKFYGLADVLSMFQKTNPEVAQMSDVDLDKRREELQRQKVALLGERS